MAVLGQIFKQISMKLIKKLKNRYKIQTRLFFATSHVVAMLYAQLEHALSLNDICDCFRFYVGYLRMLRARPTAMLMLHLPTKSPDWLVMTS